MTEKTQKTIKDLANQSSIELHQVYMGLQGLNSLDISPQVKGFIEKHIAAVTEKIDRIHELSIYNEMDEFYGDRDHAPWRRS